MLDEEKAILEQQDSIPYIYLQPPRSLGDNVPCSPTLLHFQHSSRKMRRGLFRVISRKTTIIVIVLVFCSLLVFRSPQNLPSPSLWSAASIFDCPSNRTNPLRIQAPAPSDAGNLSKLWNDFKKLIEANRPVPHHIDRPKQKQPDPPPRPKLGSFFALSDEDAGTTRKYHEEIIRNLPAYPKTAFSGRGIVMLAGGRYSEYAATSLGMIREMQSKLPVEVWIKDEEEDVPGWCEELAQEGMACRKLSDYMDVTELKHSYALKVFTILFSSFQEILFLDADSCPIVNPYTVFESEVYKKNGVVLWPDYWKHTGSPWLPYLTGMTDSQSEMLMDEQSVESGQIVWDKARHWRSLLMSTFYNYYGPDFWYTVFNNGWAGWGDKDTFPMALKALKEPYYQVPHGILTTFVSGSLLGIGMIQSNPANQTYGAPMFLHSNIIKWSARNLACKGCDDLPGNRPSHYHLEDKDSKIHKHLTDGRRIFATGQMDEKGIDPEPYMWKAVEWTSCHSTAWGSDQMCNHVRGYMEKAFGFEFRRSRLASVVGNGQQFCLIQPSAFKKPADGH